MKFNFTLLLFTSLLLINATSRASEMIEFSGASQNVKFQSKIKADGEGELIVKTASNRYTCPLVLDSKHVFNGRNPHLEVRLQRKPCSPQDANLEAALREKTEFHLSPYAKNTAVVWIFEYAGGINTSRLSIQEMPFVEFMRRPAAEKSLEPYHFDRKTFDYQKLK